VPSGTIGLIIVKEKSLAGNEIVRGGSVEPPASYIDLKLYQEQQLK